MTDDNREPIASSALLSDHGAERRHSAANTTSNWFGRFFAHTSALIKKNILVLQRRPLSALSLVISIPIAIFLCLIISGLIIEFSSSSSGDSRSVYEFAKCTRDDAYGRSSAASPPCVSVLYAPSNTETDKIMSHFATLTGMTVGVDVRAASTYADGVVEVLTNLGFYDVFLSFNLSNPSGPYTYEAAVNASAPTRFNALQVAVEQAILFYDANQTPTRADLPNIGVEVISATSNEVSATEGPTEHNTVSLVGGKLITVVSVTALTLLSYSMVVEEKRKKILGLLRLNGMVELSYWLSWLTTLSAAALLGSLIYVSAGNATRWPLFTRTNFFVWLFALFLYAVSACCQGLFFAAVATNHVQVVSLLYFCVTALLATIVFDDNVIYNSSIIVVKILFFWFPHIHFGKVFNDLINGSKVVTLRQSSGAFLTEARHFAFDDIYNRIDDNAPSNDALLEQMGLAAIYLSLAWYFGQVTSDGLGSSKPFYFLFTPEYWGLNKPKTSIVAGDQIALEQILSRENESIRTYNLTKTFENVTAVKEVTMEIPTDSVFALLGHNGSGKTTTINVLSGLTSPTFGAAFVLGFDVRREQDAIRNIVGHCPQDNLLWDDLTAAEHLYLYGAMRGIPPAALHESAVSKLSDFSMHHYANLVSSAMSGGMKRRLSMSIATLGDPAIVFLDEPTTGMDPVSKHEVWASIRKLKRGRIIVLTTHSMTEADNLGDVVAMLQGGRLRAIGTPLYLKNHYGSGYQVRLLTNPDRQLQVQQEVTKLIPEATVMASNSTDVTISFPRRSAGHLTEFFRWVESVIEVEAGQTIRVSRAEPPPQSRGEPNDEEEAKGLVKEWTFSMSTLEEVFLKVCVADQGVNRMDVDAAAVSHTCVLCNENDTELVVLYTDDRRPVQVTGVVCRMCALGSARYQDEEAKLNAELNMHVDVPDELFHNPSIAQADPAKLMSEQHQQVHDHDDDKKEADPPVTSDGKQAQPSPTNHPLATKKTKQRTVESMIRQRAPATLTGITAFLPQLQAVYTKNLLMMWFFRKSFYFKLFVMLLAMLSTFFIGNTSGECGAYNPPKSFPCSNDLAGQIAYFNQRPGAVSTSNPATQLPLWAYRNSPYEVWIRDASTGTPFSAYNKPGFSNTQGSIVTKSSALADLVSSVQQQLNRNSTSLEDVPECTSVFKRGVVVYNATGKGIDLNAKWASEFPYWGMNFLTSDPNTLDVDFTVRVLECTDNTVMYFDVTNAQCSLPFDYQYCSDFTTPQIPLFINAVHNSVGSTRNSSFRGINAIKYQLPDVTFVPVLAEGSIGVTIFYVVLLSLLMFPQTVSRTLQERESGMTYLTRLHGISAWRYWLSNFLFDFTLVVVWNLLFIGTAYIAQVKVFANTNAGLFVLVFTANAVGNTGTAVFIAGLFKRSLPASITTYILVVAFALMAGPLDQNITQEHWPFWMFLFPPLAYIRCVSMVVRYGGSSVPPDSDLAIATACLFGFGALYFIVGVWLNGVRDHTRWLWCINRSTVDRWIHRSIDDHDDDVVNAEDLLQDKPDVIAETKRAANSQDPNAMVRLVRLRKRFPAKTIGGPSTVAVKHLSLCIDRGVCQGLLGPNGSGKTTTMSILTGLLDATRGEAFVAGHNVRTDIHSIYKKLGICPQFDIVFKELTVREHLYFFVRLHNVSREDQDAVVQSLASMVSLQGDAFNLKGSELSGGMRRRLSLAISLAGQPEVWLLDEPSTGLSVDARREIWDIVQKQKQLGRTIILTTHSMEEADVLCDRIGILTKGELQCVGSKEDLKRRFGDGYHLSLMFDQEPSDDTVSRLVEFLTHVVDRVKVSARLGVMLELSVSQQHGIDTVIKIFKLMESRKADMKRHFGVSEWGLSQTSLEEVFVRVVNRT